MQVFIVFAIVLFLLALNVQGMRPRNEISEKFLENVAGILYALAASCVCGVIAAMIIG